MLKFCHRNKGAISVFLTLILLPVLLLGGLTVDAARVYMAKVVISDAGEMAMNAGLAQYEDRLHDEYGLLVMKKSPEAMEAELAGYFDKSLNGKGIPGAEDYNKILDLVSKQFDAINLEGSQIYKTEVEKQQIVEYMKYRAPVCLAELVLEKLDELKDTKKKAEAMEAQMEFGEAMEECQDSMEEAKKALDELNDLLNAYPSQSEIEAELEATHQEYTIRVSRCLLMIAAISQYGEADGRNDAEASAKSYIEAAKGVSRGDNADSQGSFEKYINCLYYQAGEDAAGGLGKVLDAHREAEPDEDTPEYEAWKERMEELEELSSDYDSAKEAVEGYPNDLRAIAIDGIKVHTDVIQDYWEKSRQGRKLAESAYKKLEIVKEKLEEASRKWNTWSEKTAALGDKAGSMQESVDEYGKFFADGDPANDKDNLGILMEHVKTDRLYFNEMRDILTEEKFFGKSIAQTDNNAQYNTYLGKANEAVDSSVNSYERIESIREAGFVGNYYHTTISNAYAMRRIDSEPFYLKLIDYCKTSESSEGNAKKSEVNTKLDKSKDAGEDAKSENGYPEYTWAMDGGMPSVLLGLVANEDADDMANVGGDVNNKKGRKNTISKFKTSISEASSFLDKLDEMIAKNLENLYVAEYAMQMLSYYTVDMKDGSKISEDQVIGLSGYKLKEHKPYKAEVEYVLWGNKSSATNIRNTVMTIFGIRLLINSFFAFTDSEIVGSAKAAAVVIAGWAPYLIPVVQVIVQLAFAGIETAGDVGKLKEGYGVTILKSKETWASMPYFGNNTDGVTLDYSEYLRIFLNLNMLVGNGERKLARIADCIRVNTDFDMKNGYTMLAVEAKVSVRTTFMKKISDMGAGGWKQPDNTYTVLYQSLLGY